MATGSAGGRGQCALRVLTSASFPSMLSQPTPKSRLRQWMTVSRAMVLPCAESFRAFANWSKEHSKFIGEPCTFKQCRAEVVTEVRFAAEHVCEGTDRKRQCGGEQARRVANSTPRACRSDRHTKWHPARRRRLVVSRILSRGRRRRGGRARHR